MNLKKYNIEDFDSEKRFLYSYLVLTGKFTYEELLETDEKAAFIFDPTKPYIPMEDDVYDILIEHYTEIEDYEKCNELVKAKELASIMLIN
jgi:hypothetical protein